MSRKHGEVCQVHLTSREVRQAHFGGWSETLSSLTGVNGFSSNQPEKCSEGENRLNKKKFSLSLDSNLARSSSSPLDKQRSSSSLHSNLTRSSSSPLDKYKTLSSQHGEPSLPNNQWETVVCVHCKLLVLHIRCVRVLSRRRSRQRSRNLQGGVSGGGYSVFSAELALYGQIGITPAIPYTRWRL